MSDLWVVVGRSVIAGGAVVEVVTSVVYQDQAKVSKGLRLFMPEGEEGVPRVGVPGVCVGHSRRRVRAGGELPMIWVWVVSFDYFFLCGVVSVESDDNDGEL